MAAAVSNYLLRYVLPITTTTTAIVLQVNRGAHITIPLRTVVH